MKIFKSFLIAIFSLLFTSCYEDIAPSPEANENPKSSTRSIIRSAVEAMNICDYIIKTNESSTRTNRIANIWNVKPILDSNTRSGQSDTIMYAVNFENNQGFALIAADKRIEPVLAVIDEGSYDDIENSNNETLHSVFEKVKSYSKSAVVNPPVFPPMPFDPTPATWYEYTDTIFPHEKETPKISVKWGQAWPENQFCPNLIAGCGPVAAMQILSYYKTPTTISYSYPNKDKSTETLNWTNLIKHEYSLSFTEENNYEIPLPLINSHYYDCTLNKDDHTTLGRLAREIGYRANASYLHSSTTTSARTGTEFDKIKNLISQLSGKKILSENNTMASLYDDLITYKNGIALVRGTGIDDKNIEVGGHVWVADALWSIGMIVKFWYYSENPADPYNKILECSTEGTIKEYIHFNWGWYGYGNGFFLMDILNPNDGYLYDNSDRKYVSDTADYRKGFRYAVFN